MGSSRFLRLCFYFCVSFDFPNIKSNRKEEKRRGKNNEEGALYLSVSAQRHLGLPPRTPPHWVGSRDPPGWAPLVQRRGESVAEGSVPAGFQFQLFLLPAVGLVEKVNLPEAQLPRQRPRRAFSLAEPQARPFLHHTQCTSRHVCMGHAHEPWPGSPWL